MTILFITAFPPSPKTAGQDYTRRFLDDLVRRGHSVSLVYASYPGHGMEMDGRVKILSCVHPRLKNCLSHPRFHPFFTRGSAGKSSRLAHTPMIASRYVDCTHSLAQNLTPDGISPYSRKNVCVHSCDCFPSGV